MIIYYLIFFIACCGALYFAGDWVVSGLSRIAKFLGWKEFAVAFFVMAMAGSLPNLLLSVISIINGVPELSFGDVIGGNVVDMTLAIALAAFLSRDGIVARSQTVQTSALFTFIAAVLPVILFIDGKMSRIDGLILVAVFLTYLYWLLSKRERFKKVYNHYNVPVEKQFGFFMRDLGKVLAGTVILLLIAEGIVISANAFSAEFGIPLAMVGILIVGLGNCFPEIYFSALAARSGESRMILGDIMGSIIIPATLVLGLVALISPFNIVNVEMFEIARYFLLVAAAFFFVCIRTDEKVTKKEALVLLSLYIVFLLTEFFVKRS